MSVRLDIVGHFGTCYSYATVASNVARALARKDALGQVSNLDPTWHPKHADLRDRVGAGSHVLLVTAPAHYLDVYAGVYGRSRAAIFVSPNTNRLSEEHANTVAKFGLVVVPSEWCAGSVETSVKDVERLQILRLGVDDALVAARDTALRRRHGRSGRQANVLHLTTDQWWPGRKGTEELLTAWSRLVQCRSDARLVVHAPPALHMQAEQRVRDLKIDGSAAVVVGASYGGESLVELLADADLIAAPSRAEGFGIMFLSALAAGIPLFCTYNTGHQGFLRDLPGWMGVPDGPWAELAGEEGWAPTVEPEVMAQHLAVAVEAGTREVMLNALFAGSTDWTRHGWSFVADEWATALMEWMEESS